MRQLEELIRDLCCQLPDRESRFQPDAKSIAAARGLMQFIPETSGDMARQLGLSDFLRTTLLILIQQFCWACSIFNLFKQLGAAPGSAASYNGGPEKCSLDRGGRSNEADRYVPERFCQTKDYVFKVMNNF